MKTDYIKNFFTPASIAVIGASERPHSVGMKVFGNLIASHFAGKLYAVNPKHQQVQGHACVASVKAVSEAIDLVVITIPAPLVPAVLEECGEKGIHNAIVLSSGFSETGPEGKELEKSMLETAKRHKLRIIGPNCLGVMQPHIKMNATFDDNFAHPGNMAFISQSGALSAAILDWSMNKNIGFSSLVSLGNSADVDFGDILDYLATDAHTQSILLYIEGIHNARHFMDSLRAVARVKPVIAIKAGRHSQGSRAALSHTGALIGNDDVFDAALKRAGVVRVLTIEELFLAAEILSSNYRVKGNRLAVITNGGGAGVMAADRASELNVSLPSPSEKMIADLNKVLPAQWSHQNPIDIIGDATPERYHAVLDICSKEENVDAILTMLVPVAMSQPIKVAEQVIADAKKSKKPIVACWMGEKHVKSSWELFDRHNIPHFDTPENAVNAFSYLADYHENQHLLKQTPSMVLVNHLKQAATDAALSIINAALAEGRKVLTTIESKGILEAFGIPVTKTINVQTVDEAVAAAKNAGFPVVMKINSPDITHKKDAGGVRLNLADAEAVRAAFDEMMKAVKAYKPDAAILGATIEPMINSPNDRELLVGVIQDVVFGPVISFGAGGSLVEIMKDRALTLPPLNEFIAGQLISQTRIAQTLGNFRNMPAVNLDQIIDVLLRISDLVCGIPVISEMDINPLIANDKQVIAVDARFVISDKPLEITIK